MLKAIRLWSLLGLCYITPAFGKETTASIYTGMSQPVVTLEVLDEGSDGSNTAPHSVIFEPNLPTILVLGGSYGIFSGSVSQDVGSNEDAMDYEDYKLSFSKSWWGVDAAYSSFTRFRINQSQGFAETLPENDLRRPDMSITYMSANAYLFPLRWGFDYDAAFDPAAEKRSGIGLGVLGSWSLLNIETKTGLLPLQWQQAFGGDGEFKSGELSGTNVQGVIAGTLGYGGFYVSGLLAYGFGEHRFEYETGTQKRSGKGEKNKLNEVIALGYAGKKYFSSFSFSDDAPDYLLKHMTLGASRSELNVVVGCKF